MYVRVSQPLTTKQMQIWLKRQPDHVKSRFALNWRIPHSVFNIAAKYFDESKLQGVNWFEIYKARDLGQWSNGNTVRAC